MDKKLIKETARFGVVGLLNTGVDFFCFYIFFYLASLDLVIANSLAFSVAVTQSFLLNKYWTFNDTDSSHSPQRAFFLFLAIQCVGLALSNLTILFLSRSVEPMLAKIFATVVTFAWNFTSTKKLVFNR